MSSNDVRVAPFSLPAAAGDFDGGSDIERLPFLFVGGEPGGSSHAASYDLGGR